MLNFVKQSFIVYLMEKYKRKFMGIRFPLPLLEKIEEIMKLKKNDNFSAVVVELCWIGLNRYSIEEKVAENQNDSEKETKYNPPVQDPPLSSSG